MSARPAAPETPRGRPAHAKPSDYRLRLPQSPRLLGGAYSVEQAGDRLATMFHLHRQLMRAIAGRLIEIAEIEIKIELAHHLYHHAEAAQGLRQRLAEMRVPASRLDGPPSSAVALVVAELMQSNGTAEFIVALHQVLGARLARFERDHERRCDALVDLPTRRLLARILPDLEEMSRWGHQVVEAFILAGEEEARLERWRAHLEKAAEQLGVFPPAPAGTVSGLRCQSAPPFRRAIGCARDDRLPTFHHTRRYDAEACGDDPYERERLESVRTQRDELDAVETFANILYDLADAPFELEMSLARFVWDEARHAEMGQQSLARLGLDPFEVPCGIIGINVRSPLPPLLAFAQISTIGELNQVGQLRRLALEGYRRGDADNARAIDFVHADEMMHLRVGRHWLSRLAAEAGESLDELSERARLRAVDRLHEEGVIDEDYRGLSARQIQALIGE